MYSLLCSKFRYNRCSSIGARDFLSEHLGWVILEYRNSARTAVTVKTMNATETIIRACFVSSGVTSTISWRRMYWLKQTECLFKPPTSQSGFTTWRGTGSLHVMIHVKKSTLGRFCWFASVILKIDPVYKDPLQTRPMLTVAESNFADFQKAPFFNSDFSQKSILDLSQALKAYQRWNADVEQFIWSTANDVVDGTQA